MCGADGYLPKKAPCLNPASRRLMRRGRFPCAVRPRFPMEGAAFLPRAKGIPNKRYTPGFKKLVIETMMAEKLSYRETARRLEVSSGIRIKDWERIYLTEGSEGFAVERRGRGSKGRPKQLPKAVEEDLLAEVQRLRAENEYLKNLQALVLERERRQGKKPR